jgi:hypothetical protein
MKALAVVVAVLLLLSGAHVRMWFAGYLVAVPLPVFVLAAELAVCALLGWLIARAAGYRPWPCSRRTA